MFKKKIVVGKELFERAEQFAREKGYADISEWVVDLLEEEMKRGQKNDPTGGTSDEDAVRKKLQGLGYIS
jgi:hypothetical protein